MRVRPPRLTVGMTVGVVSPSSAVRDTRFERGLSAIEARGYRVELGEHVYDRHGYLAGTDTLRAADLTRMLTRRDVDAVFCARGGYGALRMVDLLDWQAVRGSPPKLFVGYSDITTLHIAIAHYTNSIAIHGPMVTSLGGELDERSTQCFWRCVEQAEPLGLYDVGGANVRTLRGGTAEGELAGGCLTLLAHAAGGREPLDFSGRIVLLEDVGEAVYRIDRMLVQLLRSGALDHAAGFVVGEITDWREHEHDESPPIQPDDVFRSLLAPLGKPVIAGFPFGHEPNPLTLPLGCRARLDADACTLEVLEPAVL